MSDQPTPASARSADQRFVVLAAIDDSALADTTSAAAARYANVARGAELHFVHVVAWVPTHAGPSERAAGADATSLLEAARVRLQKIASECKFERDVICHIALGDTAQEILQMAAHINADLIFVGSHGRRGLQRLLLGSTAERVVRGASCPVLVVRDKDYHRTLAPEIRARMPQVPRSAARVERQEAMVRAARRKACPRASALRATRHVRGRLDADPSLRLACEPTPRRGSDLRLACEPTPRRGSDLCAA